MPIATVFVDQGDPTTITSDIESLTLSNNTTLTITFGTLAPIFSEHPASQALITGGTISLSTQAAGRLPLGYQWRFNETNISGANQSSFAIANAQVTNAGSYTVVVTNPFGTNESNPALVTIKDLLVTADGQAVTNTSFSGIAPVTIGLASRFTNGDIFYTLDGSAPDFTSSQYEGPFEVTTNAMLRAVGYSADFSQSVVSDPLAITILPSFFVSAFSDGGGGVQITPSPGPYALGTTVTVVAVPNPGFVFMGWAGDATGTNLTNTLVVDRPLRAEAMFGTTLGTSVTGNGTVSVHPAAAVFPYGATVQVKASPNPGNYFALWGNAAAGSENPLSFQVFQATPSISALFAALPANQVSLTVLADGGGTVSVSPGGNKYGVGVTNVVTATAMQGQRFLGWSGDATGTNDPLSVVMNTNKVIMAHFSHSSTLGILLSGSGANLNFDGVPGDAVQIQASSNLIDWLPLFAGTNFFGETSFTDPTGINHQARFYRALTH